MNDKIKKIILRMLNSKPPVRGVKFNFYLDDESSDELNLNVVIDLDENKNWTSWMLTGTADEMVRHVLGFMQLQDFWDIKKFNSFIVNTEGVGRQELKENMMFISENTKSEILRDLKNYLKRFEYGTDSYGIMFKANLHDIEYYELSEEIVFNIEINVKEIVLRDDKVVLNFDPKKFNDSDNAEEFINMTCGWLYNLGAESEIEEIFLNKLGHDFMLDESAQWVNTNLIAFKILGSQVNDCDETDMDFYENLIFDYFETVTGSTTD